CTPPVSARLKIDAPVLILTVSFRVLDACRADNPAVRQLYRLIFDGTKQVSDLRIGPELPRCRPGPPAICRSHHHSPPLLGAGAYFVKQHQITVPRLKQHRIPAGVLKRIILNTRGHLLRPRPRSAAQTGNMNTDIRKSLVRTTKKRNNEA